MPFRISLLAALVCWIGVSARADEKIITGGYDLNTLSSSLSSSNRILNVRIDNYANPGELKITPAANALDTILLHRFSSDSDGVIKVDSTFIDAKGFTGTLILKNLAFRLTKSRAVLIAGFDLNQPNNHLTLDSCTLYADTLDGLFLSWQGDTASRVDIRNSWFVARGSTTNTASIQIATGSVSLSNCLFNFAGTINGSSISKRFDAFSNTANRVQFKLSGNPVGGVDPSYSFAQNLIAFHGTVNTLGGDPYYVLNALGFSDPRSSIQGNRIYSVWKGFDAPSGTKGKAGLTSMDSVYDGKASSELWDWYTDAKDPLTGLLSGNSTLRRYNVLPGRTFVDTLIGADSLRVNFKSADFPRMFRWNMGAAPDLLDSAYRPLAVLPGRLSFGPFQVDSIRDNAIAEFGKPILLDQSSGNLFLPQASTSRYNGTSVFQNRTPQARVYALVDSGNTPRGFAVEPFLPTAEKFEHIRFLRVVEAGETILKTPANENMPDSLRYLKRVFGFGTSANAPGQVTFSSKLNTIVPWSKQSEGAWFWYWRAKDTLIPVTGGVIWGDSLLYGSFNYQNHDSSFFAYLVEKLSVHAGATTKTIPGATLLSGSASGYQLYIDSSVVDPGRFGSPTKGYKFAWTGRGANDSLFLILKSPAPEAQAFAQVPGKADADLLPLTADSLGNFRIPIGPDDSGKVFFAGAKYNVLAATPFSGIVNGVSVGGLYSTTPGMLAYRDLSQSAAQKLGSNRDSVFQNTRFLGGNLDASIGLNVTRDYNLALNITKPLTSDTAETWALIAGKWVNISAVANVIGDTDRVLIRYSSQQPLPTDIVVLERFKAPDAYFKTNLDPRVDSLVFSLSPVIPGTTNPVVAYCLEVHTLGINGEMSQSPCVKQDPTVATKLPIVGKTAYAYRIVYYVGADTTTVSLPQPLVYPAQFGWNVNDAIQGNPDLIALAQGQWHLIAVPAVDTTLKALLDSSPRTATDTVRDTTMVLGLHLDKNGETKFDSTQQYDSYRMGASRAILLASSHPLALTVNHLPSSPRKSLKPEVLATKQGWNLIGNPFPVTLGKNCIKPQKPHPVRWWQLIYDVNVAGKYRWDSTLLAVPPLRGFAYYSAQAESLTIDPSDTTPPAPVAHAKIAAGSGRLRIGVESPWGGSSMALVRGAGEYPVRYLPMPSSPLELRVGGDGGFFLKPVDDLARVDEPVEIRSSREGTVRFILGESGQSPAFAIIDQSTGAIYDQSSAGEVPVSQGSHNYRLLAGDPAFVGEQTQAFLASTPSAIALSQNFPNPARGITRIAIEWPATQSRDRRATLEVLDLQGRRLALRRLDGIQVGRQLIEVDASAWKPGIYIYRLAVVTGGRVLRLQKRMLVTP
ncbi:MAG: T9SS type A sorting domain-containing protein [Fibrobacteres bacterium]|nr:T9SS type A sorting domain-containing protein [Fibrobacterota bacterium]